MVVFAPREIRSIDSAAVCEITSPCLRAIARTARARRSRFFGHPAAASSTGSGRGYWASSNILGVTSPPPVISDLSSLKSVKAREFVELLYRLVKKARHRYLRSSVRARPSASNPWGARAHNATKIGTTTSVGRRGGVENSFILEETDGLLYAADKGVPRLEQPWPKVLGHVGGVRWCTPLE